MPILRDKGIVERILDRRNKLLQRAQSGEGVIAPSTPKPVPPVPSPQGGELPKVAREFRKGLAEEIGVPPEAISPDLVRKWYEGWTKAMLRPEYWGEGASPQFLLKFRRLGRILGRIADSGMKNSSGEPIERYAKEMAKVTDKSVEEIKNSKPFKNYKRTFG